MAYIYKLYFDNPNNFYIGSTVNFNRRKARHTNELKKNKHANEHLQRAYNKYNKLNFEILEECNRENLIKREQHHIDTLTPYYNICKIAYSCLGVKRSEETKEKQRSAHLGRWTQEKRMEMRMRKLGKPNFGARNKKPSIKSEESRESNKQKRRLCPNITKLNEEKVKDIKLMLREGCTKRLCAEKYNVHIGTIQSIHIGKTWSDIKID